MTGAEFSLLSLVAAFTGLVLWVYWPGRRDRLESYGAMPLEDQAETPRAGRQRDDEERT